MTNARALDFFAGSGLVRLGLEPEFQTVWANDVCPRKAAVYDANCPHHPIRVQSVVDVRGADLPRAELAWASFPCQDLSLAGNLNGIRRGTRSGLFWEWLRVLDELNERRPPLLVAENVVGFLIGKDGAYFEQAHRALRDRGYLVGAVVMDARRFVPQSRPRAFVIAVDSRLDVSDLAQIGPGAFHPEPVLAAAAAVRDAEWVWWSMPEPARATGTFGDLCERDAPCDSAAQSAAWRAILSAGSRRKLQEQMQSGRCAVGTGYRRTRPDESGRKRQRLEVRFDGVAGCLRTPGGGSSRQLVLIVEDGEVRTRLMTVRECARLMGAPDWYQVPGSYNDGYRAMGDAVAVPVVRWLTRHLLSPLAGRWRESNAARAA